MTEFTIPPSQLPDKAQVKYELTADGDRVPVSVTYNDACGKDRTVKMVRTLDGDFIPETGHTLDGDFHFPNKKFTYLL